MSTPDDFERLLIEELRERAEVIYALPDSERRNPDWTREMKEVFLSHASNVSCACKIARNPREFIWDVSYIASCEDEVRGVWNFQLAAEIEWGQSVREVLYDFRKLIAGNVPHRFMLFDRTPNDKFSERMEEMLRVVPHDFKGRIVFVGIKNNADKSDSPIFIADCQEFGTGVSGA